MVGVPGRGQETALVPASSGERGAPRTGVVDARPAAPSPRPSIEPRPAHASTRRAGKPLRALGGDFLAASLALLCRDEPLSRAEIGDHADVIAEVADALAAVADRLAHDLDAAGRDEAGAPGPDGAATVAADLVRARDALHDGSVQTRRGAAELWARHIESLRTQVEQARGVEPASITRG